MVQDDVTVIVADQTTPDKMPIRTKSVLQPWYGSLGKDFSAISAGSATSAPVC